MTAGHDDPQQRLRRRQRTRNIALATGLVALVVLFYLITLVKIGGNVSP